MTATAKRALSLLAAGLLVSVPQVLPVGGPWRAAWLTVVPLVTWVAGLYAPVPTRTRRRSKTDA